MTSDSPAAAGHGADVPVTRWQHFLLWLGAPLCIAGLVANRLWSQWHEGRFAELLVLGGMSLAFAGVLHRALRWPWANGLVAAWLLALALFAGAVPLLATLLVTLAALALGDLLVRGMPVAVRIACGLMLAAGVLGWLLPLPVHHRAVYLGACVALVAWRWRSLLAVTRDAVVAWQTAVDGAPRPALFALLVLGLASTACWLPTMQADDVVYHLRLPWQLMLEQHYPLDPGLHIWSMAPWAADVLQAVPQVIAGAEARGGLNALWMAITAAGVWRLARMLDGSPRAAWLAVALYASLPLTAVLAGGMQTETPTTALLVWLAWTILASHETATKPLRAGAILLGGLLALKLASAVFALVLVVFAFARHRRVPSASALVATTAVTLLIAGSSYVYAAVVARNPVLPLFNAWFRSPYFDAVNFDDPRWHAGFDAALPWNLTFHTERYLEAFAGGGGFVLIVLAGAWLLALWQRRTRALAGLATVLVLLPLVPLQYLRYVFPALVVLLPALVVATLNIDARRGVWLIGLACVLNLAFQANGFWLLRVGLVKMTLLEGGRDAGAFRAYTPERNLIARIRQVPHGNVLALDPDRPYVAELGTEGRSISSYDRAMQRAAAAAEADATGAAWAAALVRHGITDLLVNPGKQTPAQRAALTRLHAARRATEGDVEWWHVPAERSR